MEVLLYFLTGAGIGGLLTYLSTRIGRKGMEVNLRILQEKAKAWEEKEQRWHLSPTYCFEVCYKVCWGEKF